MSSRTLWIALVLVLAIVVSAHGQGGSPITFFYGSPGQHATWGLAINNVGQVAGGIGDSFGSWPGLGLIYQGGHFTIFRYLGGAPTGPEFTRVNGINNRSDTVGVFSSAQKFAAFLRRADGTFLTLVGPPNAQYLTPADVNDWRQIVGSYTKGSVVHGFVRSPRGAYTRIDYPGSGAGSANSGTYVTGVNNAGTIVGYFRSTSTIAIGFVYVRGRFSKVQCSNQGVAVPTQLLGINNLGQILVACNGDYFVRTRSGRRMVAINHSTLGRATITALNDYGDVVGYHSQPQWPATDEAFIIPNVVSR